MNVNPGRRAHYVRRLRAACALVTAAMAAGCAAHHSTESNPFIRQGEPTVDLGGTPPQSATSMYASQLRKLAETAKPRPKTTNPDGAETIDPGLHEAVMALQAAPSAAAHRRVAGEYRRLGVLDAAFSHLSSAIRLDPKDATAYDMRARLWRAWNLPGLGIPDARKAASLAPRSATAWNTLGLLLEAAESPDRGVSAYRRAIAIDGRAAYAWSNLCHAWMLRQVPSAAAQACRQALALDPTLHWAQVNLFDAERQLGPAPEAAVKETIAGR